MIRVPRREHKLLVAIHGWSGILLGLLLLVIVATGTVAVMGDEIGTWSSGTLETRSPLTRSIDKDVRRVLPMVSVDAYRQLELSTTTDNHLRLLFRGDPGPQERGLSLEIAHGGRILHRFEGLTRDIADADPAGALASLLINLHIRLYVPEPWGYILTGVAGLAMLVAAVSGFLIHRHLLADIFTLRRAARPVLLQRDRHSVAGAWVLPFVILLAFTGCFFSFADSIGFPALSWISFGGDQQKLFEALDGAPAAIDPTPANGVDLDGIIADATARAGIEPDYLSIAHPSHADARVTVTHKTRDGDLSPVVLVYDGVTGAFVQDRPPIGHVPSTGGAAFSLMGPLHFGNFAGLISKGLWSALGFMTCFLTVSGMRLWLARRDLSRLTWAVLDRAVSVAAFGLPFAMGCGGVAFLLALPSGTTVFWTGATFVAGAVLAITSATMVARPTLDDRLRWAAGGVLLALPIVRLVMGGPSWFAALQAGQPTIPIGDVVMLLIGFAFAIGPYRAWHRSSQAAQTTAQEQPAE